MLKKCYILLISFVFSISVSRIVQSDQIDSSQTNPLTLNDQAETVVAEDKSSDQTDNSNASEDPTNKERTLTSTSYETDSETGNQVKVETYSDGYMVKTEETPIPYQTTYITDANIEDGVEKVQVPGQNGVRYQIRTSTDNFVTWTQSFETKEPTTEIIRVGTKVAQASDSQDNTNTSSSSKTEDSKTSSTTKKNNSKTIVGNNGSESSSDSNKSNETKTKKNSKKEAKNQNKAAKSKKKSKKSKKKLKDLPGTGDETENKAILSGILLITLGAVSLMSYATKKMNK